MQQTFIDLDELILLCRDKSSQKFIQEAVACYRAGAFRSCIVSTWNAVVFDFLHKLRELELFGDKKAPKLLQEFEKLRLAENFKDLWQFESDIPKKAHDEEFELELISPVERLDIERLLKDRNRCAHPSMTSLEDPFEATAELARYHLRSAITHLLQRPPVQGRAARDRIFKDIKSEYFPVDSEEAIKYFQQSPLARARFNLIQDIVIGLTTSLLIENLPELERERQFSALIAVSKMYVQETGKILNEKLSGIIINKVDDDNWDKVIIYLAKITVWESLSEPCQLKAQNFVKKLEVYEGKNSFLSGVDRLSPNLKILIKAAHIDFLRDYVIKKFDNIPVKDILSLHDICGDNLFQTKIILPSLIKSVPEASFNELLLIRIKTPLVSDETILSCIKEKAKFSSLNDLANIMSNYNYEFWQDFIEDILEYKIINADFDELLSAKSKYNSSGKSKPEIIELFNSYINEKILEVDFDVLLKSSTYWCEVEEEKLILNFQNNLPGKVDLKKLLSAKSKYNSSGKSKPEIIELFNSYINERISEIDWDYFLGASKYWCEIDRENLVLIFQKFVQKIVDFDELLSAKLKYNLLGDSVPKIIEIFDNCIDHKIKEMPFSDLLKYAVHDRQVIPEKLLLPILKNNTSPIVTHFTESSSFADANKRSELIIMIAEELNEDQWKLILTAFFDNNQICGSWDCLANFRKLFKKSLELNNNSVQPYWLPFREKLGSGNQNFKQLKQLIDLYLTPEQKNQLNN